MTPPDTTAPDVAEIAATAERDAIAAWLRAGAKFVVAGCLTPSDRQAGVRDAYKFAADEIQAGQHYPFRRAHLLKDER